MPRSFILISSILTLSLVVGCSASIPPVKDRPITARKVYAHALETPADFFNLSKRVGSERFTKFVIDLRAGQIIYFDVNVYKMHTHFVFGEIFKRKFTNNELFEFNRNYSAVKPQFIFGYLVNHAEHGIWTVSLYSGDQATAAHVQFMIDRVKASFYGGAQIKFLPDSSHQEGLLASLPNVPSTTRDALYKAAPYHAFTPGTAVGRLRIVTPAQAAKPESLDLKKDEVVVLPGDLPDIGVVAGIISETFSTPLSHVALRARSRGIPHIGLKMASSQYAALAGKTVWLSVTPEGYVLREATRDEAEGWIVEHSRPPRVRVPRLDTRTTKLTWLKDIRATQTGTFGAKAANLGEVAHAQLPGVNVPAGFAIPMHYYARHAPRLPEPLTEADLPALRRQIVERPLDPILLAHVMTLIRGAGPDKGWFVRSSTNAEDLEGFNGAGLYDTVPNVKADEEAIAKAIKTVWASVWNRRAFREREHFGIDHRFVHAAVLVQVGVNATAAGVLVTRDLYDRDSKYVYTINAKWGLGIRVVQGRKIPEIVLFDYAQLTTRVLSRSDEKTQLVFDEKGGVKEVPIANPGEPVLSDTRAHELVLVVRSLVPLFEWTQPLDVEWLFEGETVHIVQVRPYITAAP